VLRLVISKIPGWATAHPIDPPLAGPAARHEATNEVQIGSSQHHRQKNRIETGAVCLTRADLRSVGNENEDRNEEIHGDSSNPIMGKEILSFDWGDEIAAVNEKRASACGGARNLGRRQKQEPVKLDLEQKNETSFLIWVRNTKMLRRRTRT
jgi:hypothetical protein